jgi:6-pyruvoyltetrahydropterin/6-carboxytetrahydropterin synthase
MFTIRKEFSCCSSHVLTGLPKEHPCARLHGHNYVIVIELKDSKLNEVGFVYDYRGLDTIKVWIDEIMDHHHLNEVFDFNPTAENIAKYIYDKAKALLPQVSAVEVCETPKTNARYHETLNVLCLNPNSTQEVLDFINELDVEAGGKEEAI